MALSLPILTQRTPALTASEAGSQPVPFTTFVIKVVSRCNLNCSYCYMYNLADRTYRDQPSVMQVSTTIALADRIARHAQRHRQPYVHLILHGGEPLLMPRKHFHRWMRIVRETLTKRVTPLFSMQSNGVLIDEDWIDSLVAERVGIGISVDGPERFHDQYRVDHRGRGSFDEVIAGIRRLQRHPRGHEIFSCVMAVVNPDIPPRELFDFWQFLDVPSLDLSLPHANHVHLPPVDRSRYGDWLVEFFDLWFDQNRADRHIRYFENMIRVLFGYPMSTDNIGGKPVGVVVVETDGSIEPTDAFKCCEHGITKLGLNVIESEFDDLYGLPLLGILQRGASALCSTCRTCDVLVMCGGGYMPHRYSRDGSFDNPSVYCDALAQVTRHVRCRVIEAIPVNLLERIAENNR